jgi:hypothetical protein|nr:hypothetical protein [uncultured Romboutsia sp.]
MRNIVEETYDKLINKWGSKEYKGIGTINCVPPIDYCEIISRIISLMRNKNDNIKILIVTDNWKRRTEIVDSLKNHNINIDTINILTHTYVNSRYNYSYDISIVVGVNEWNLSCNTVFNHARFKLMILTEKTIDTSMLTKIYNNIPPINNILNSSGMRAILPVEEHREQILFTSQEDITNYDKYTEFITQTIQVFGNLDNIKCARNGTQDGRSAMQYITEIAEYNGWSADMDMTNPFSKQIDECYNPLVLAERVKTFYNIVRERMLICSDNVCKLERIVEIIKDNPDKRFLIISKRGEYAATVTKYINDKLGEICGDYHDKIEDKVLVDDNGIPVLYKTGSKKGQPRIVKSKAISTLNLKSFNDGLLRVLSIKNNSTDSLETSVDEWILTSPLCDTINELIYRYNNVNCSQSKLKVHKLYIAGTIEEASLKKEKLSANHEVIQNVNSDISAQNFDDIVC